MSGVDKMSRLRKVGVFRDFEWPADLTAFAQYNLIYGWNASGKTTLSRVLRYLERRRRPPTGEITLSVDGEDLRGDSFPEATLSIKVFNRDFVEESVFPVGGGDVPPIYVFGRESAEKQREVEGFKASLIKGQEDLGSLQNHKTGAEGQLDKLCIDRAKVIKDTLRAAGENPYNNYDKSSFRSRSQKMEKDGDRSSNVLSDEERTKALVQHTALPKPKITEINYQLPDLQELLDTVTGFMRETVVSKVIQVLKDDPLLSEWMHQGLQLHQERHADRCLFCEQTLPIGRLDALQGHFSAEYETLLKSINDEIDSLKRLRTTASSLTLPNSAEIYEDLVRDYDNAVSVWTATRALLCTFLDSLVERLAQKKNATFEILLPGIDLPHVDATAIESVNGVIQKHNKACDDFQKRVSKARRRLEADIVAQRLEEFCRLEEEVQALALSVLQKEVEAQQLREKIVRLEMEVIEHRRPAEELNEDLRNYLGHDELRMAIKDTGYSITRGGVPATALSEGERTAIALLYFLKSLQDRSFELERGTVVLDDPVSSLDANALYLAFGYIRERTENAQQLFVLTHNFGFFRQVRNWFHHLPHQKKRDINRRPARFYMLECECNQGQRFAAVRPLDSLLEEYESEYHFLFARVYKAAKSQTPAELEKSYALPNMARRLLEAFLAFRQPQVSGNLWRKLKGITFDEAKKARILRFLHTYSHGDAIAEPGHDLSVLGEAGFVLNDLLELIKTEDHRHFAAMEQLLNGVTPEGDGD